MGNVLDDTDQHKILALGRLGWPLLRIQRATGIRRETISAYLKAAGIPVRGRGRPSEAIAKPAISPPGVSTDPWPRPPSRAPQASACEPYRERIEAAVQRGRNAMAIWQDLVDELAFPGRYASVRRFVRQLKAATPPEARVVIVTPPGEEGQVDYGDGPMVRHPDTGKYRRTRLFVLTLAYSRKSIRLLTWHSSAQVWAELHERAFRRLGGAPKVIVLDNLKEGVLTPDVYERALNPLYRDVLAHYGVVGLPCRVPERPHHNLEVGGTEQVEGLARKGRQPTEVGAVEERCIREDVVPTGAADAVAKEKMRSASLINALQGGLEGHERQVALRSLPRVLALMKIRP